MVKKRDRRLQINISGEIFETFESTLQRFPDTLLANKRRREPFYCYYSDQFFFDRNRNCFGAILFLYQSNGILRCPPDIDVSIFVTECEFFEIPNNMIVEMKLRTGIVSIEDEDEVATKGKQYRTYYDHLWDILENPETSRVAYVYSTFSLTIILFSVLCISFETLAIPKHRIRRHEKNVWWIIEVVCNFWFFIELLLRIIIAPSKMKFIKSLLNWIDIFAFFPYFGLLIFSGNTSGTLGFLRCLRFVRVVRLVRLLKYGNKLTFLSSIVKIHLGDFQLLTALFSILLVLGGSVMFYVEGYLAQEHSKFRSIPESFWFTIQTITTLGYGDIVPQTVWGKFLSSCFMMCCVITMTIPVLSVVTRFTNIYLKNLYKHVPTASTRKLSATF